MSYDSRRDEEDRPRRRPAREGHGPSAIRSLLLLGLGAILAAGVILAVGYFRTRNAPPLTNPAAQLRDATPKPPPDDDEKEAIELFKKVKSSVVNVDIVQVRRSGWDEQGNELQTAAGSGFIWDDDGRIVTNYHVVEDVGRRPGQLIARVVLADRTAYDAVVVGAAPDYDLAVLQFSPDNRPPKDKIRKIELGTSHDLDVGQKAFAIGNPYGLSLTMTKGIISALGRTIESPTHTPIPGGIQTDAAINPGNSGGPLLDRAGRLIGVNTAITTPTAHGGNVGIGFAIPSDTVNQVVTEIIQTGRALRPTLGITLFDQQKLRRARYDHGVMIESTRPNGPADKAGLQGIRVNKRTGRVEQVGDIVLAINGEPIESPDDYERAVRKLRPGEQAVLHIVRGETEKDVTVTVGGT